MPSCLVLPLGILILLSKKIVPERAFCIQDVKAMIKYLIGYISLFGVRKILIVANERSDPNFIIPFSFFQS